MENKEAVKLIMVHLDGELPNSFRAVCHSCAYDHNGNVRYKTEIMADVAVPYQVDYCQMCGRK